MKTKVEAYNAQRQKAAKKDGGFWAHLALKHNAKCKFYRVNLTLLDNRLGASEINLDQIFPK